MAERYYFYEDTIYGNTVCLKNAVRCSDEFTPEQLRHLENGEEITEEDGTVISMNMDDFE